MDRLIYNEEIYGYKAFNKGLINQYGNIYKLGHSYHFKDFSKENSFYFCKNIEDCFIFYRNTDNVDVCLVKGYGVLDPYCNDYYGIYDVYSSSKIDIISKLDRKDIINMFLNINDYYQGRLYRFLSLYKLSYEEILLFIMKYHNNNEILRWIDYFQLDNKNAFVKKIKKKS